jgi:hypothetical protein
MNSFTSAITYFPSEGRSHLDECLRLAFASARKHDLKKLVIFTARGEGLKLALNLQGEDESIGDISLVGVTFPCGKSFTDADRNPLAVEIDAVDRKYFREKGVALVTANMPLDPIRAKFKEHGVLGQDSGLIANALGIFGGGLTLCVQAILMACDAGEIEIGEHVVAMSADTAIVARAAPTAQLLTELIVREIICKPVFLTIGKGEEVTKDTPKQLPITLEGDSGVSGSTDHALKQSTKS